MIKPDVLLDFIKERRSIRQYQEKDIPEDEIEMILEAGRWAPSGSNKQPWEFIVVKDKDKIREIEKVASYGKFIKQVPVLIAIVGKPSINPKWYIQDTSLASMNMMLMAWALKIGTCWIGTMNREKAKAILDIDKNDFLLTVLPLGYIKGNIPSLTPRKDIVQIKREIKK
jgi:nitroreductase